MLGELMGRRSRRAGSEICSVYAKAAINQRLGAVSGLMPDRGTETSEALVQFFRLSEPLPTLKTARSTP